MNGKEEQIERDRNELLHILKALKEGSGERAILYRRKTELEDRIVEAGYAYQQERLGIVEKQKKERKKLGRRLARWED
ncbi:hypothetical protein SAMN02745150_01173 [Brevinema andersonii]|uniref:Uncharacterized protein n=1 Tax=Brevinema andersonii TaxID=34097 RepID=A0A1I1EMI6_BREAD|nr:hypothetical protein [Brevinema andersonii]SFB88237.1 hypothetical protein SAMN02745150_01173 [Brevinema andersonii]